MQAGAAVWQALLQDHAASLPVLADKLVAMAVYYNFDGWLVNIENPIAPVTQTKKKRKKKRKEKKKKKKERKKERKKEDDDGYEQRGRGGET